MILTLKWVHNWYKRVHKLTFPSERKKEKVKAQARAKTDILFARHICPTATERTDSENGMSCLWANDRECAMSSSSSPTSSQTRTARGDTTTAFQTSEPGWSVFCSQRLQWRSRCIRIYGWQKRKNTDGTNRTDTFDSVSFRRCRHQQDRYFQHSCHG